VNVAASDDVLDPMQERVNAAQRLATIVAGDDDARFIRTVHAVLNAIDAPELQAGAARSAGRPPAAAGGRRRAAPRPDAAAAPSSAIPADSVFSDPVYLANARWVLSRRRRIVGGVPVSDFADCVAIGSSDAWCCTGTLVAPNVVVTAGHCDRGGCGERIFVGTDVERPDEGRIVTVAERATHPGYRPPRKHDDIAVLVLDGTVDDVTPRAIAPASALTGARAVRVVGYGHTDADGSTGYGIRRLVDVPLATNDPAFGGEPTTEFVAGAPFLDRDSCSGDSGGPAYIFHRNAWRLVGATSRATATSVRACGDGGIYTLVAAFDEWLAPFLAASGTTTKKTRGRRRGAPR
jgi:hypothetical protein